MIRRRTITSYVWNSVSGNKMVILSNCIRNFFRKFELLGNSVQGENPAPDNPQEIKSAGRKSKNLLIENISVFTVQDNIAYIPLPEGHETKLYTMLIQKKPGENDDVGFTCGFYDKSNMTATYSALCLQAGNLVTGNGIVNSKIGVNHFVCFSPADSRFFDIYNVMYAEGKETTLDYEPYGYLLDVKVTGKNLLDMADIQNENGKIDSVFSKAKSIKPFKVIKDRKYLLISKGAMIVDVRYSSIYFGEDDLAYEQDSSRKLATGVGYSCFIGTETRKILVAKETCTITKTMMHGTRTEKDAYEVEELGLFEIINDNPNIDYQPYTEQSIQIALDEPLRGIGEYKDVLTKDGVVRKIKRIVLDGSEDEKWELSREHENHINFALAIKGAITVNTGIRTMMDKFKYFGAIWNSDILGQDMFGATLRINMPKTLATDLQTFKTWLSQNPLTVDYVLAEPATEPLPESVQQQLQALHSENGTTHVFVDSGEVECGINIEYKYKS